MASPSIRSFFVILIGASVVVSLGPFAIGTPVRSDSPNRVIYVDNSATGAQTGTSWQDAYLTIWDAVQDLSNESGVEIVVAQGSGPYVESVDFELTTDDGGSPGSPNVIRAKQGDVPVVDFVNFNGVGGRTISWIEIRGFQFGTKASFSFGGTAGYQGAVVENCSFPLAINNVVSFTWCSSVCRAAGLVVEGGITVAFVSSSQGVILEGNSFLRPNSAGIGTTTGIAGTAVRIESNIISRVSAGLGGMGINSLLDGDEIRGNTTTRSVSGSLPVGIAVASIGGATVKGNVSTENAFAGMYDGQGTMSLAYNDVWGNNPDYWNSSPGPGSLSVDPMYVDPSSDDYHLQPGSPLVDQGDPAWPGIPLRDVDGQSRLLDGDLSGNARMDMGADEVARSVLSHTGLALPGSTVTYVVTGVPGDQAILFLGFNAPGAVLVQPFGLFELGLVPLPVFLLASGTLDGGGTFSVPFPLSSNPNLLWLTFDVQAVVGPSPLAGQAQMTERVSLRIGD